VQEFFSYSLAVRTYVRYTEIMREQAERGATTAVIEEIAEVCGVLNAATGRLVSLIAGVLETRSWQGSGIHSASQWVAWQCGVSPGRARSLVLMARRLGELPETRAALEAGEVSEDQVAVVCRHAPASMDAEAATLACSSTVVQLRRTLGSLPLQDGDGVEKTESTNPEERRQVSFGPTAIGTWRLSAELPPEEGALVERALTAARDELFRAGEQDGSKARVDWADALVAMADRSLGGSSRRHSDRHLVLLHIGTEPGAGGHLHLGPGLNDGIRRFLGCDARVRPVFEAAGKPVSVGRALRTVPERSRIVVEERDRGCRVPGCDRSRWLQVHHIVHWEDGGATDTANLLALCHRHHRLHHLGKLGISGDADDPNGVLFTDERGEALTSCGRAQPPGRPPAWASLREAV
jgi:hypothetical protein